MSLEISSNSDFITQNHLSSIQESLNCSLQGIESRNEFLQEGSTKYISISTEMKERARILQTYGVSLQLKQNDLKDAMNAFKEKREQHLNEIRQEEKLIQNQLDKLENQLNQIHCKIKEINENKFFLEGQMNNDVVQENIEEFKQNIFNIDNKINISNTNVKQYQSKLRILTPVVDILKSLRSLHQQNQIIVEELSEIDQKSEITNEVIFTKEKKIKTLRTNCKNVEKEIDSYRSDRIAMKNTKLQLQHEKNKVSQFTQELSKIETENRVIEKWYDEQIQIEIKIARSLHELDEKIKNRDPHLIELENQVSELEKDYNSLFLKKEELTFIETTLSNDLDTIDQRFLLEKERYFDEIKLAAVHQEQKLFNSLHNDTQSVEKLKNEIEQLLMAINVLEAEKERLVKKIAIANKTLEKYQRKHNKKPKSSRLGQNSETIKLSIETLEFQVEQMNCVIQHKKEDIQTLKIRFDQALNKLLIPPKPVNIVKRKRLDPLIPVLNKRYTVAQILSTSALYMKNIIQNQLDDWKMINDDAIIDTMKRWEHTIEDLDPVIEKNMLRAQIELVC